MNKFLFGSILLFSWLIAGIIIVLNFQNFTENYTTFFSSVCEFNFSFSISRFIKTVAFSALLYFVFNSVRYWNVDKMKGKLNFFLRYKNTLIDSESLILKVGLFLSTIYICLFSMIAFLQIAKLPETTIALLIFSTIGVFELIKKEKLNEEDLISNIFTDEPITEYYLLKNFQKNEVKTLKNLIELKTNEYLSIAINGKWGSGKTSILLSVKDLLENGNNAENISPGKVEIIQLNLWQTKTPENAIDELERLFVELFKKVYVHVSSNDVAFFSLLAESINSKFSTTLRTWLGENVSISASRINLEQQLKKVLNHLNKEKLVILIDDLDRIPEEYLNGFFKVIRYVTGLKNVISISGINRDKIISHLGKQEIITIKADGLNPTFQFMHTMQNINSQGKPLNPHEAREGTNLKEKQNFNFPLFDEESMINKIFTVQRELSIPQYEIVDYLNEIQNKIESFCSILKFIDKEDIKGQIIEFLNSNFTSLNTFRDVKLFLNDAFIYFIGFGGEEQKNIMLSEYIDIQSILAMSWAKIVYPEFYKNFREYVTPFNYQNQFRNEDYGNQTYHFDSFKEEQYKYFDEGKEFTVNTRAHQQIMSIFDKIDGDTSFQNVDAAIKYFFPFIDRFEFTTVEFASTFKDKEVDEFKIKEFLQTKWKKKPEFVFKDFIARLNRREFDLGERLNSALALFDLKIIDYEEQPNDTFSLQRNIEYWNQILTLFEDKTLLNDSPYTTIIEKIDYPDLFKKLFGLFEKIVIYNIFKEYNSLPIGKNRSNFFYRFFNPSESLADVDGQILKNYEFLLKKIEEYPFVNVGYEFVGIYNVYTFSQRYWRSKPVDSRLTKPKELVPIFLSSLFQSINNHASPKEINIKENWDLVYDAISYEFDDLVFELPNLKIVLYLFKNRIFSFSYFMNAIQDRSKNCTLDDLTKTNAYKMLSDFLVSDAEYESYKEDYMKYLKNFFQIIDK